jgi:hypothetical protein
VVKFKVFEEGKVPYLTSGMLCLVRRKVVGSLNIFLPITCNGHIGQPKTCSTLKIPLITLNYGACMQSIGKRLKDLCNNPKCAPHGKMSLVIYCKVVTFNVLLSLQSDHHGAFASYGALKNV